VAPVEAGDQVGAFVPGDRVLVVANPMSRRDIRRIIAALRRAAPEGVKIDTWLTTRAGEARELAATHAPGARLVVAVGGDGTVADVAEAAIAQGLPLAIVPAGSTNIIARELGIPSDPDAGAALIFGRHGLKLIDVGRGDDRIFLHIAGAGFDSRFFARSNPQLKRKVGWLAYLPAGARALWDRPSEVRVRVDDTEVRCVSPLVMVANGGSVIHSAMRIASGISKSDGVFDVFVVAARNPVEKARVLGRFATRNLDRSPYVTRLRGRHVELHADPPLPVQCDGDVVGDTPMVFDMIERALQVVVPEARARAPV
jgi:diacylglycerol kinase family enzyme